MSIQSNPECGSVHKRAPVERSRRAVLRTVGRGAALAVMLGMLAACGGGGGGGTVSTGGLPGDTSVPFRPPVSGASNVKLSLSWDANPDQVEGYKVYFGTDPSSTDKQVDDLMAGSRLFDASAPTATYQAGSDLGLNPGDQACFRIKAYNASGDSAPSDPICTTV